MTDDAACATPTEPFRMAIEDVFFVAGRGYVVTGIVQRGTVAIGDDVQVYGGREGLTKIAAVDLNGRPVADAAKGDNVGIMLLNWDGRLLDRGQMLGTPGSLRTCPEFLFEATLTEDALAKEAPPLGGPPGADRVRISFDECRVTVVADLYHDLDDRGRLVGTGRARLSPPMAIDAGFGFSVVGPGKRRGRGTVREVLLSASDPDRLAQGAPTDPSTEPRS